MDIENMDISSEPLFRKLTEQYISIFDVNSEAEVCFHYYS